MARSTREKLNDLLRDVGCHDIDVTKGNNHYQVFFSFNGAKAKPITLSSTPSSRMAPNKQASDFSSELRRLGVEPSLIREFKANYISQAVTGSISHAVKGFSPVPSTLTALDNYRRQRAAWNQLAAIADGTMSLEDLDQSEDSG